MTAPVLSRSEVEAFQRVMKWPGDLDKLIATCLSALDARDAATADIASLREANRKLRKWVSDYRRADALRAALQEKPDV